MACEGRGHTCGLIWKHAFLSDHWDLPGILDVLMYHLSLNSPWCWTSHFPENSLLVSLLDEWVSCSLHAWVQSPCGWQTAPSPCWRDPEVSTLHSRSYLLWLSRCVLPTVAMGLECPTQSALGHMLPYSHLCAMSYNPLLKYAADSLRRPYQQVVKTVTKLISTMSTELSLRRSLKILLLIPVWTECVLRGHNFEVVT